MAINLNAQYSTKNVPVSTNYPYGQGMNVSAQGAGDAVPWEAAVFNDWNGYFQALLTAAAIVPSGTPDNAVTSQYLAALNGLFLNQTSNLSDLPSAATARTNLGVISSTESDTRYARSTETIRNIRYVVVNLAVNGMVSIPSGSIGAVIQLVFTTGTGPARMTQGGVELLRLSTSGSAITVANISTVFFSPDLIQSINVSGGSARKIVHWIYAD